MPALSCVCQSDSLPMSASGLGVCSASSASAACSATASHSSFLAATASPQQASLSGGSSR